jgi:hypothetical protein
MLRPFRRSAPGSALTLALVVFACFGSAALGAVFAVARLEPPGPSAGAVNVSAQQAAVKRGPRGFRGRRGPRGFAGDDGAQGLQGPVGPQGLQGPAGKDGAAGPAGSALAYAHVTVSSGTPSLDAGRTKGFTSVGKDATGIFCLYGAGDPANGTASVDGLAPGLGISAGVSTEDTSCSGSESVTVTVYDKDGNLTDDAFYVAVN